MVGVYDALWRSLTLYLEDLSPGQHVAVMMATVATTVAVLVGGCWTYRHRSISTYNSADSSVDLQAGGKCTSLFFVEYGHITRFNYLRILQQPLLFTI